jgi:hypothetical protein
MITVSPAAGPNIFRRTLHAVPSWTPSWILNFPQGWRQAIRTFDWGTQNFSKMQTIFFPSRKKQQPRTRLSQGTYL